MKSLRIFLLTFLSFILFKMEGFGQAKEYFFVKEVTYGIYCDSLFGSGFKIVVKGDRYFSILPIDSEINITIVDKSKSKTYKAFSKKVNLEPSLYLSRGAKRMCEVCGEYNLKSKEYSLDKECFYMSRFGTVKPDIELTNISELWNNTGYRPDLVKLKISKKGSQSFEKTLTQPDFNSSFGKLDIPLENEFSYIIEASIIKYSIQRADGSILSFETPGKRKIKFEVK